jgi:hypothetical protein
MTVENALCTVADEPKLLDFGPIEAHAGFTSCKVKLAAVMTHLHQEHVHAARKWLSDDALPRPGFKRTAV